MIGLFTKTLNPGIVGGGSFYPQRYFKNWLVGHTSFPDLKLKKKIFSLFKIQNIKKKCLTISNHNLVL